MTPGIAAVTAPHRGRNRRDTSPSTMQEPGKRKMVGSGLFGYHRAPTPPRSPSPVSERSVAMQSSVTPKSEQVAEEEAQAQKEKEENLRQILLKQFAKKKRTPTHAQKEAERKLDKPDTQSK
eukprot:CAMPEP_0175156326 /NCGR_PEP_ID=MMETSP0087-20121206/21529_1 /TAXON_ID=136419 /ORGANISM="Unknown Unknown, Strain D1" /LENGTH=121 /DNA_ID=CAMNT_0016443701 /DNA_START=372 /DNA_END=735 /DNA_ORIENTATION=-